jgi:hypothetical protein
VDAEPVYFTSYHDLSKPTRAAILKNLHITKTSKKKGQTTNQDEIDNVQAVYNAFLENNQSFVHSVDEFIFSVHEEFKESMRDPVEPPPPAPQKVPFEPLPRILRMQRSLRRLRNDPLNYWNCAESEFAYTVAIPPRNARVLSTRTLLFDPPRFFDREEDIITEPADQSFVTQDFGVKQPRGGSRFSTRPTTSVSVAQHTAWPIHFGEVPANKRKICTMTIRNTGLRPIHFGLSQLSQPGLKVMALPCVVYPGLKTSLRVELLATEQGEINDAFRVKSMGIELTVPVLAKIVEPEPEPEQPPEEPPQVEPEEE